jgi:hypothetical protein
MKGWIHHTDQGDVSMSTLAAIMTSPDVAEVCFLVAVILFAVELVVRVTRPANWVYESVLLVAGLLFVALGFLAL